MSKLERTVVPDTRALAEQCKELSRTMRRDHGVVSVQTKDGKDE